MLSYDEFKKRVEFHIIDPGQISEFPLDYIRPDSGSIKVALQDSKSTLFSYDASGVEYLYFRMFKYNLKEIKNHNAAIDAFYIMYLRLGLDFNAKFYIATTQVCSITGDIEFGCFMIEVP